jgi:Fe-S cluster biosynthesis and repair protein YggX
MLQLMAMGFVDGNYDATEQTLCRAIGEAMGFDETELTAFESWVVRQTMLLQEAQSFWAEAEEG